MKGKQENLFTLLQVETEAFGRRTEAERENGQILSCSKLRQWLFDKSRSSDSKIDH